MRKRSTPWDEQRDIRQVILPEIMDEPEIPPSLRRESSALAIALVGFMGAGKTTVGQALAERLGWRFLDLDDLIEKRRGRTIPEIFRREGEPAFRDLEYSMLREIIEARDLGHVVLALGGGAFAGENIRTLLSRWRVPAICLDAPVEELYERCEQPGVVRPLRTDLKEFRELYEKRRPSYGKANFSVSTGGKNVASIVEEIISRLGLAPDAGVAE